MKDVVVVVVTYNRKELLKECLEALLKSDYKYFKVLIIDNCSTDGTYEFIRSYLHSDKVIYIRCNKNIGGAGGFNFGIRKAMELQPEYIWLMDDDCIVNNSSLTELIVFADKCNDRFGFLSSVVKWKDGSICRMNVQKVSLTKHVKDFDKVQTLKFATFVSFFIKATTVKEVGLPIAEFFIWGDDFEYSSRVSLKYKSYLVPTSIVTHKSKANIGSSLEKDDAKNFWRYEFAYRNEKYLYDKLGLKARLYFSCKVRLHIYKILKSPLNDKKQRVAIIMDSIEAAKRFKPDIEFV